MTEENKKFAPVESYELPSQGKIYGVTVNPHVELRSMTIRHEMMRTSITDNEYKLLASIIEDCMVEKPAIPVYEMHIGDFEYLLHKLRIVTYGPDYKMTTMCPFCNHIEESVVDLDTEEVIPFKEEEFNKAKEVKLTDGKVITLKFQTPQILDTIRNETDKLQNDSKNQNLNFELKVTLKNAIDLVDGKKLSYVELDTFVDKLSARDVNKINNRISKLNKMVGLKNEVKYTCGKCKTDVTTFFRFGTEFFRPTDD